MPLRKKDRFLAAFLTALAISTSSFAQPAPARVQVAYVAISGTQGALWVAQETGLFRKYGLETNLIYVAGASRVIQATLAGDMGIYGKNAKGRGKDPSRPQEYRYPLSSRRDRTAEEFFSGQPRYRKELSARLYRMKKAQTDSPAKEKLLEQAQELMLAKGFAATTVDEICRAAGLTKGSFFHYFGSKEELGKEVLDRFCRFQMERLAKNPLLRRRDPLERLYGWVDGAIEMSKTPMARKGCLLGNFAQELSDTHPKLRSQCAQRFSEWADMLKKEFDEAGAKHLPGTRLDTQGLAEHLIAVLEGSLILAKAKRDMRVVEKNLIHFKRYLKALFGG